MPRIRTIKPEFWGDEKLAPMPPIDRLVFLGLVSLADDQGRLVDNLKTIDGAIFSETEDSSRDSLAALASAGRIVRYTAASGQKLIQVANWSKHQKVDHPKRELLHGPTAEDVVLSVDTANGISSRERRASTSHEPREIGAPHTNDLRPATSDQRSTSMNGHKAIHATTEKVSNPNVPAVGSGEPSAEGQTLAESLGMTDEQFAVHRQTRVNEARRLAAAERGTA